MRRIFILLILAVLLSPLSAIGEQRSCGTHWTGWMKEADPSRNPCPEQCERGERLGERTWGNAPDIQYDVQYQCYFPAPRQSAYEDTPAGNAVKTDPAENDVFPFIRGRVDDISAANGAWLNWHTKLNPVPQNLRGKEAWLPVFEKISDFIKQSPALATMREYYPWLSYGVDEGYEPLPRAQISMIFWLPEWIEPAPGTPDNIKLKSGAWGSAPGGVDFWMNWFPTSTVGASDELSPSDWYKDNQGVFFRIRKPDRLIDGFPVHGGWLFVTGKNKPPLFVPISRERALQAFMAQAQRLMNDTVKGHEGINESLELYNSAEMRKFRQQAIDEAGAGEKDPVKAAQMRAKATSDDAEQENQLRQAGMVSASSSPLHAAAEKAYNQWSQVLQRLGEAERNSPAFVANDPDTFLGEDLVSAGAPDAVALMRYNPDYVNGQLDAYVPQLLIMPIGSSTDWNRSADVLSRMEVRDRAALAIVERTRWSEIQGYIQ